MSELRRDKLLHRVCVRLGDQVIDEVDAYVREREDQAQVPLTRALGVREILEQWARERIEAKAAKALTVARAREYPISEDRRADLVSTKSPRSPRDPRS